MMAQRGITHAFEQDINLTNTCSLSDLHRIIFREYFHISKGLNILLEGMYVYKWVYFLTHQMGVLFVSAKLMHT